MLGHIFNLLFLNPHIIIILIIGIQHILINIANQPDIKIHLNIPFRQSLKCGFTQVHVAVVHHWHISGHVHFLFLKLALVGHVYHVWDSVLDEDFLLVVADHVAFGNFGADLFLEHGSEFRHWYLVLGDEILQQCSNFIDVDVLKIVFGQSSIRQLDLLDF